MILLFYGTRGTFQSLETELSDVPDLIVRCVQSSHWLHYELPTTRGQMSWSTLIQTPVWTKALQTPHCSIYTWKNTWHNPSWRTGLNDNLGSLIVWNFYHLSIQRRSAYEIITKGHRDIPSDQVGIPCIQHKVVGVEDILRILPSWWHADSRHPWNFSCHPSIGPSFWWISSDFHYQKENTCVGSSDNFPEHQPVLHWVFDATKLHGTESIWWHYINQPCKLVSVEMMQMRNA